MQIVVFHVEHCRNELGCYTACCRLFALFVASLPLGVVPIMKGDDDLYYFFAWLLCVFAVGSFTYLFLWWLNKVILTLNLVNF